MSLIRRLRFQVRLLLQRRKVEHEMAEEMRLHIEQRQRENVEAGLTPEEARYAAQRCFGGLEQAKEQCRDVRWWRWIEDVVSDIRYAARSLGRRPGFSFTLVVMLTLGIGLSTFVYKLTAWRLLLEFPRTESSELLLIGARDAKGDIVPWRADFHFWSYLEQVTAFEAYAAVKRDVANVVVEGEPLAAQLISTSQGTFDTLGVSPALGRGFLSEEHGPGADQVVVISDLFWRRHFNASPDVLGQAVVVNGQVCTIVGVLRAAQAFPLYFGGGEVFRPLVLTAPDPSQGIGSILFVLGRLRADASVAQATEQLARIELPALPSWLADYLKDHRAAVFTAAELNPLALPGVIFAAGGLLFAIVCLNGANLMLLRLLQRSRELSIRLALGGTRRRLGRLLALESMLLVATAAGLVMLAAGLVFPVLFAYVANDPARRYASNLDSQTLRCILVLGGVTFASMTLAPLFRLARTACFSGLKEGGFTLGETPRVARVRAALVALQAGSVLVLLVGTGLFVRSFERLSRVDFGFDATGMVKVQITLPPRYPISPEQQRQRFEQLQQRLELLPGVRAVSFGQDSLLIGYFAGTAQLQLPDGEYVPVAGNFVSATFHQAAGLQLVRGRWLSGQSGAVEAVINETMARTLFGEADPLGQAFKIKVSGDLAYTVVGVVRDVRDAVKSSAGIRFYVPDWMYPQNINTLVLRLDRDPPPEFAALVRRTVYEREPDWVVVSAASIRELVEQAVAGDRYIFRVMKGLTGVGLLLAMAGLFAVVAYTVDGRRREFGVRLALGATPGNLLRLVLKRGLFMTALGIGLGLVAALALTRFMRSVLFETDPYDPIVYLGVAATLLVAAAMACWIPARRAAKVDPLLALRAE